MRWWQRLFPKRSLDSIREPSVVRVRGVIAAGPEVDSPVTERRAPILGWFFSRRYTDYSASLMGSSRRRPAVDQDAYGPPIAAGLFTAEWVLVDVGGRIVRVATPGLRVGLASSEWDGQILNALPPRLSHIRVDTDDPNLRYGERWLDVGDTVVLSGTVARVDEASSPYRGGGGSGAPRAELEARGPARLTDTIGAQLRLAVPG